MGRLSRGRLGPPGRPHIHYGCYCTGSSGRSVHSRIYITFGLTYSLGRTRSYIFTSNMKLEAKLCVFVTVTRTGACFFIFLFLRHSWSVSHLRDFLGSDNSFYGLNYGNAVGCPNKIRRDPIGPPSTVGSTLFKHTACSSQHELTLQISTDRHPHPHSDTCLL